MPDFRRFLRRLFGSEPRAAEPKIELDVDAPPVTEPEYDRDAPAAPPDRGPVPAGGMTRTVTAHGFSVVLDLTSQVLAVRAPEDRDDAWGGDAGPVEASITPTLAGLRPRQMTSAAVLAQKAKIFDDGLYAAVEVAAQEGAGRHGGKARLLGAVGQMLGSVDPATAGGVQRVLLAAAQLGEVPVEGSTPIVAQLVEEAVQIFLGDELRSKPIGFYTWSDGLRRVFRQDRCLQQELSGEGGIALVIRALREHPELKQIYETQLRLTERLTNPFAKPDLRGFPEAEAAGAPGSGLHFFPPSVSHETELIKKLYGASPIPDDFVLANEMIRRIRSGQLDLTPGAQSGWYDHQTWALEPLVILDRMPEGPRLLLDDEYEGLLVDLFKGLLTLTRETHIKQLEIPTVGCAPPGPLGQKPPVVIRIAPQLSAEPLPTFYLRRALAYRFVRGVLEETFGGDALTTMHRLTSAGPVEAPLGAELADTEALFVGAHVCTCRQLGMPLDPAAGDDDEAGTAARRFTSWAGNLETDPDLSQDLRTMVPVFFDIGRGQTKVWLFLGWSMRRIDVSFARHPGVTIFDQKGKPPTTPPVIMWETLHDELFYPVTAEVYVDRLLNRDEFRKLCDEYGTRSAILRALDAGG